MQATHLGPTLPPFPYFSLPLPVTFVMPLVAADLTENPEFIYPTCIQRPRRNVAKMFHIEKTRMIGLKYDDRQMMMHYRNIRQMDGRAVGIAITITHDADAR